MILITEKTTRYTVQPENEAKVRALIAKAVNPCRKRRMHADTSRVYPRFKPGMTTGEYIAAYGGQRPPGAPSAPVLIDKTWPGWDRPAPMLDPSMPKCVEWEAAE